MPVNIQQVDEWKQRAEALEPQSLKDIEKPLAELDAHLTLRSHIVGYETTEADTTVWRTLRENRVAYAYIKQGLMINVTRWFKFIEAISPKINVADRPAKTANTDGELKGSDANYDIGLQDTEHGVVTRFPPEPSGYLHIGHAKAALLNDYFAHKKYKGTLILRFDDTNPMKEKQEFEDSIVKDLALMGIVPDKISHTSDYFNELYEICLQMLKEGTAYADDTAQEILRDERMKGIASKRRDATIEENLTHFEEMHKNSPEGKRWFIRAKISVDDPNKAMRDPAIYRCSDEPHHRTGDTWKIYPTYDFCCPIVDAIEGVTHALRTTEYRDRDAQYQWILSKLKLRHVYNWDFSRLSFVRTVLSKRKLTKIVDSGRVWGWDDPRMPTVRGIRRRGCTIPALQEFILRQGPSKNIVNLEWGQFWATNKKYIDPIAPRYTAVADTDKVTVTLTGAREAPHTEMKPVHAKNDSLGTKKVVFSKTILLEQADAAALAQDEEVTLMNWGNAIVRNISHSVHPLQLKRVVSTVAMDLHLQGDFKTTKKKLTWLSADQELVPVQLVDFGYLINKDKLTEEDKLEDCLTPETEYRTSVLADCNAAGLNADAIIQFDRKGFFRVDTPYKHGKPAIMFQIPTGKTK